MPQKKDLNDLSTPELHAKNEKYRSKFTRRDTAWRAGGEVWESFGGVGLDSDGIRDAHKEFHAEPRNKAARKYTKSQDALAKRGEKESDYPTSRYMKDSFQGSFDGSLKCAVM